VGPTFTFWLIAPWSAPFESKMQARTVTMEFGTNPVKLTRMPPASTVTWTTSPSRPPCSMLLHALSRGSGAAEVTVAAGPASAVRATTSTASQARRPRRRLEGVGCLLALGLVSIGPLEAIGSATESTEVPPRQTRPFLFALYYRGIKARRHGQPGRRRAPAALVAPDARRSLGRGSRPGRQGRRA